MRPPPNAPAREKILFHLKTKGPQTAGQLARRLGVTAMAVRQQVARLEEEGLLSRRAEAGRVGRPRHVFSLTERAASRFPDSHADLALDLLEAARRGLGAEGLGRLLEARAQAQRTTYEARMPSEGSTLRRRVASLCRIRREEGYMADWSQKRDGSFVLVENHCPICVAAKACVGLCEGELSLFRSLLGPDTTVEREEYLLGGDRRCLYRITPAPRRGRARRPRRDAAAG